LKEKWAKEKELKAQIFKEKKEAEFRNVKLLCQQAFRNYDRIKSDKNNHVVSSIKCQLVTKFDESPEQQDVYSENYDQHYLQSASYLGSTSNELFFPFIALDQNIQTLNSASSDQNKPWLQPFNDRITLKCSMVV
jgi:hypothetical protein